MFAHKHYIDNTVTIVRPTIDTGKGLTKQADKDRVDINYIMKRYQKTGMIDFGTNQAGEYLTIGSVDFQEAMNIIVRANEMFAEMPSSHRKRFGNDPRQFLEFIEDPANADEARKLGLLNAIPQAPDTAPLEADAPAEPA